MYLGNYSTELIYYPVNQNQPQLYVNSMTESGITTTDTITRIRLVPRTISEGAKSIVDNGIIRVLKAIRVLTESATSITDTLGKFDLIKRIIVDGSVTQLNNNNPNGINNMGSAAGFTHVGIRMTVTGWVGGLVTIKMSRGGFTPATGTMYCRILTGATGGSLGTVISQAPESYNVSTPPVYPSTTDWTFNLPYVYVNNQEIMIELFEDEISYGTYGIYVFGGGSLSNGDSRYYLYPSGPWSNFYTTLGMRGPFLDTGVHISDSLAAGFKRVKFITESGITIASSLIRVLFSKRTLSAGATSITDTLSRITKYIRTIIMVTNTIQQDQSPSSPSQGPYGNLWVQQWVNLKVGAQLTAIGMAASNIGFACDILIYSDNGSDYPSTCIDVPTLKNTYLPATSGNMYFWDISSYNVTIPASGKIWIGYRSYSSVGATAYHTAGHQPIDLGYTTFAGYNGSGAQVSPYPNGATQTGANFYMEMKLTYPAESSLPITDSLVRSTFIRRVMSEIAINLTDALHTFKTRIRLAYAFITKRLTTGWEH